MRTAEDIERDRQRIIRDMRWWWLRKFNPWRRLSWAVDDWYYRWYEQWRGKARKAYPVQWRMIEGMIVDRLTQIRHTNDAREQWRLIGDMARIINTRRRLLVYAVMPWWAICLDWVYDNVWSGVLQGRFLRFAWEWWKVQRSTKETQG